MRYYVDGFHLLFTGTAKMLALTCLTRGAPASHGLSSFGGSLTGRVVNEAVFFVSRSPQPLPQPSPGHGLRAAGIDPYDPAASAPHELVSFGGSFHGRTLGALALTAKDQYKTPFAPLTPGALMVPYCDLEAAARVIQKVWSLREEI